MKNIRLNNGYPLPEIGFGTFKMEADETCDICLKALSAGYRYIDTASYYGNEEGVGKEKTPATCR